MGAASSEEEVLDPLERPFNKETWVQCHSRVFLSDAVSSGPLFVSSQ